MGGIVDDGTVLTGLQLEQTDNRARKSAEREPGLIELAIPVLTTRRLHLLERAEREFSVY